MYKSVKASTTSIKVNQAVEGETIEAKVRRITEQKAAITDGAPQIFTERADGVLPEHNIRTDRWELAVDAMDKVSQNRIAKREGAAQTAEPKKKGEAKTKAKAKKGGESQADGGTQQAGESKAGPSE